MMTRHKPTTAAEAREAMILSWSEAQLQDVVIDAAKALGWSLVYHTFNSKRSEPGYPDLHMLHPGRKASMFREIKATKGTTTEAQLRWLAGLTAAGLDAGVWRPADWVSGLIMDELKGMAHVQAG